MANLYCRQRTWFGSRVAVGVALAALGCGADLVPHGQPSPDARGNPPPSSCAGDPDRAANGCWACTTNPDGTRHCVNPDCTQQPSGEFGCTGGGSPLPPGPAPPSGWHCMPDEFGHEVCDGGPSVDASVDSPGMPTGSDCPTPGQQQWCDGPTYCGWGKRSCETQADGTWRWGSCNEGTTGPATPCACMNPFGFDSQCCERPDCLVVGEQPLPCGAMNGDLCAPCLSDANCAAGYFCVRQTQQGYCSRGCSTASDCGPGYLCFFAPGSPMLSCMPFLGRCSFP